MLIAGIRARFYVVIVVFVVLFCGEVVGDYEYVWFLMVSRGLEGLDILGVHSSLQSRKGKAFLESYNFLQ